MPPVVRSRAYARTDVCKRSYTLLSAWKTVINNDVCPTTSSPGSGQAKRRRLPIATRTVFTRRFGDGPIYNGVSRRQHSRVVWKLVENRDNNDTLSVCTANKTTSIIRILELSARFKRKLFVKTGMPHVSPISSNVEKTCGRVEIIPTDLTRCVKHKFNT